MAASRGSTAPSTARNGDPTIEPAGGAAAKEKQALQQLVVDVRRLLGPIQALTSVRPGAQDALDRLESAIEKLPSSKAVADGLDVLRSQARSLVAECRRARIQGFGRLEAEFIAAVRTAGEPVRELADGWRVGPLEIQIDRAKAQCRAMYNREQVVPWTKVVGMQDFQLLQRKAKACLAKVAIPEERLGKMFSEAYDESVRRRPRAQASSQCRVALRNFYPELRLALMRFDLERKSESPPAFSEFPLWAFLYNVDRYRQLTRSDRLTFQTGSQEETRRLGVVIGGLDAKQDYSQVCFILRD